MKTTKILYSKNLNKKKFDALQIQAKLLGQLKSNIWNKFGSISGIGIKDRQIRDKWLADKHCLSPLSANSWKETLRDSISNISMNMEAAKVKAKKSIRKHTTDKSEQKTLYLQLKSNKWLENKYLSRIMRKYWIRGHNHTYNQIIVRSDDYSTFIKNNKIWVSVPSLVRNKRIPIPLSSNVNPSGTLRLILRNNKIEVHYAAEIEQKNDCGDKILGIDKGFTEVFVDSDGTHYGEGLGKLISEESDYLKQKYKSRNKLFQIAKKSLAIKKDKIKKNNLGRKKINKHTEKSRNSIKTLVYTSTHKLVDKAKVIIAEDLSSKMNKKSFGKNMNRKLSAWTKGVIADSLKNISQRRSSSLQLINPAYTSQIDSSTGCLTGVRKNDQFHCENGVVFQSDENAARNVLARLYDPEIDRWTNYKTVKSILLKRTERYRLKLFNLDSSYKSKDLLTESELPFKLVKNE